MVAVGRTGSPLRIAPAPRTAVKSSSWIVSSTTPTSDLAVALRPRSRRRSRDDRRCSWSSRRAGRRPSAARWSRRRWCPPRRGFRRPAEPPGCPSTISSLAGAVDLGDHVGRRGLRAQLRRASRSSPARCSSAAPRASSVASATSSSSGSSTAADGSRRAVAMVGADGRRRDLLRPRRAERRHPARRGGARGCRREALADDWERALSYGTGIGHPELCEWIAAELHGIDAEQVMVTNGSMEAAALLFHYLVEPGDRVIVEQPSYDRTLLLLGRIGAELVPVPLEADGIEIEAFERALLEGGPVKLVHVIPNFHNPAGCTLSEAQAPAPGRARRRARLQDLRGRSLPAGQLRRRAAADDALARRGRSGASTPRRSRRRSAPASGSATSPGPPSRSRCWPSAAREHYISPNMLAESIVLELCRSGALAREHRVRQRRAAPAPRRARRGARRPAFPRPSSSSPAAATSSGSTSPRTPTRAGPARGRQGGGRRLRRRPRLHARGRRVEPAALVRERARSSASTRASRGSPGRSSRSAPAAPV